jgi:hypothetical protein
LIEIEAKKQMNLRERVVGLCENTLWAIMVMKKSLISKF